MTTKKRTLLIDIDGVACDHASAICERVSQEFGITCSREDVSSYDHDFGPITFCGAVDRYYPDERFILSMPVSSGFVEFLNSAALSFRVVFATARKHSHDATSQWVKTRLGDYAVTFGGRKADIKGDFLIDDYPPECIGAARMGITSFLIDQPWNRDLCERRSLKETGKGYPMGSFEEILKWFWENCDGCGGSS
jgi:5'(3')-deoxyribonucleotidase